MKQATRKTEQPDDGDEAALEAARELGRGLGQSHAYEKFEAAHGRFQADEAAQARLAAFESRQREVQQAVMWGGAGAEEKQALEREWKALCAIPAVGDYLRAQEEFTASLRESARMISDAIGVDFGAVCSPSGSPGGCC